MASDYFIQAQDYLDDWPSNISVAMPRITGKAAAVVVGLGATKQSTYRLTVSLAKEKDAWRIREVAKLES